MKNLRKLNKRELKTIKGGNVPIGCNSWDPRARCCNAWDTDHCQNATCPNSPPSSC
ncbi:bacteriocin-like protein [Chryseobacterium paridis]|uniref:Bacteriocin n=1 Tax=Chryseobacterium paridis TaxID=2800328 RepID=A0ABS1FUI0_9FLAO|nr:hypothetical protein [Chryseobacterium paridis]MBK1896060.1 hypothetical protein [Chryseobacterium paridis]